MPLTLPDYTPSASSQNYEETATYLANAANEITAEAERFLAGLESNNINLNVGDLPEFNSVVWLGSLYGLGDRPVRPDIEIPNYSAILDKLELLTPPDAPTTDTDYTDPGYSSLLRDPFLAKLLDDMVNGGYGIETADELALWTRARDREAQATQANIDEVRRQASHTGFALPPGALNVAILRARQTGLATISGTNREIALKRADMYVENRRFILDKVLQSEDQSMRLYDSIENRRIQVIQVKAQLAISLFDAGVRAFTAQQNALLKQLEAGIENARALATIYGADVQAYTAFVNSVVAGAQIDIANSRNVLARDIQRQQAAVEQVKFRLEQLRLTTENSKDINKFGTEFYRTALGGVMNGINGLAVQTGEA